MNKAMALCALLAVGACERGPRDTLALADELLAHGHSAAAAAMLRRVALRPATEQAGGEPAEALGARVRLARVETFTLADYPQALADWAAVRSHPLASPALKLEAIRQSADVLRSHLSRPDEAVALLREARDELGAHPEGAAVRAELLAILSELGDIDGVLLEATSLIERFANSPEAQGARLAEAQALFVQGAHKEALESYLALGAHAPSPALRAVALSGAGDCLQELGEGTAALERYYAALKEHPNPAMVQAKVARVRARLYHLAPQDRILNASRPSRHVAAWQPRPTPADLGFDRVPLRHSVRLAPSRP